MLCEFLSILNHSLHCNPLLEISWPGKLCPIQHIPIRTLSMALGKDPDITLQRLQRSQSLCDLTTIPYTTRSCDYRCWDRSKFIKRTKSCPDLLGMQLVHNMDPQLHAFMSRMNKSNDYYYKNNEQSTPAKRPKNKKRLRPVKHPKTTSSQSDSVC